MRKWSHSPWSHSGLWSPFFQEGLTCPTEIHNILHLRRQSIVRKMCPCVSRVGRDPQGFVSQALRAKQ